MDSGTYTADIFYVGNKEYRAVNTTAKITVNQLTTTTTLSYVNNTYNSITLNTVVNPSSASGNVVFTVNGNNYTVKLSGGKATYKLSDLTAGSYNVKVVYLGNHNYVPSFDSKNFTISKAKSSVTIAEINDVEYGTESIVNFNVVNRTSVRYILTKNGEEVKKGSISSSNINLGALSIGTYKITVINNENENYLGSSDTKTFNVNNIMPKINIENDTVFIYEKLNIELPKDATGNITVRLYNYWYNGYLENGKYTIIIPEFDVGNYTLTIYYYGDEKYNSCELIKNVYLTYLKKDLNLTIDFPSEIEVGSEGGFNEMLYIDNLPYNATGLLTLYIDGKKVENQKQMIYNLKNVIEFKCPYLKEGIHNWEIKFAGDIRYNNASVSGSFKVINLIEPIGEAIVSMDGSIVYGNEYFKFLREVKTPETTYKIYNLIVDGNEYFILKDIERGAGLFDNPCYKIFNPKEYELYDKFYYKTNNGVVSDVISAYNYVIIDGVYYEFLGRPMEYYGNEKDYYYEVIDNVCYKGGFYHLYKAIENVDYKIINSEYYTLNGEKIPVRENYVWYVINNGSCDKRDNLYWNHWAFSVGYDYIKVNNDYYRLIKGQFDEKTQDYNLYALINGKIYHVIDGEIGLPIDAKYIIDAPDVTKYYHGPERFVVTLKDLNGKAISNAQIKITINGLTSTRTTDSNGQTSMGINLNSGKYTAEVEYDDMKVNSTVTVKPTISGNNVTKIYRNDTQYYATFTDTSGNLLKNTDVNFNINGVFYTRKTNDLGVAKMNINLLPGEYIITAYNPVSTEQYSNLIKVLPSIITYDLTKYYKNASRLTFKLLDNQGRPVGAGVSATININGVLYTRQTNASGYINMNVNLNPGTYIATLNHNGLMASSTVKILPILEAKDVVMKYRDGTKFEAKLLDGQGKPFAGQTLTFNINGVMYNRVTDGSGVARLNLNLMAGEYIITSMYENGATIANKVTIRS